MNLSVYIPRNGPRMAGTIDKGSGIVGSPASEWVENSSRVLPDDSWRIVIDYEGRRYNQANMERFADKVFHAAGRHTEHYPTTARRYVEADDVLEVATFDGERITPLNEGAAGLLRAWIGSDDPKELEVTR